MKNLESVYLRNGQDRQDASCIHRSLLNVTNVFISNTKLRIDIEVHNKDTVGIHYNFIAYTTDANSYIIQSETLLWSLPFVGFTKYSYTLSNRITTTFPLSIYFTYQNVTGSNHCICHILNKFHSYLINRI